MDKQPQTEKLPENLKRAMDDARLSASELARRSGVSMASLSRILSGQVNPSLSHMMRISDVLNISLDRLVGKVSLSPVKTPLAFEDEAEYRAHATADSLRHETDVMATFVLENTTLRPSEAARLLSSAATGSWVASWTEGLVDHNKYPTPHPIVAMELEPGTISIDVAFPQELFEAGSLVNLISVIAASCTSTGARIDDIRIPPILLRTYTGPVLGVGGMRDALNKYGRPLLSGTMRPAMGLSAKMYGRAAYEALKGGVDMTCDPTTLHDLPANPLRERLLYIAEALDNARTETNEDKIHAPNITASTVEQMKERIDMAAEHEVNAVLVDSGAIGWSALQSVAQYCRKEHIILCAMGGRALSNGPLSQQLLAKLLRFSGCDVVSVGSPLRGDSAQRRVVKGIVGALRGEDMPAQPEGGMTFDQPTCGIRPAFPACGGGHNPWHLPQLLDAFGDDIIFQCGGAIMGHPWGSMAGAVANRVAIEALVQARNGGKKLAVEGRHILKQAAKNSPELTEALHFWREGSFLFGVIEGDEDKPRFDGAVITSLDATRTKTKLRTIKADDTEGDKQ